MVRYERRNGKLKYAGVGNSQESKKVWAGKTAGQLGECPICPKCDCEIDLTLTSTMSLPAFWPTSSSSELGLPASQ
jgi:hypothetical protein